MKEEIKLIVFLYYKYCHHIKPSFLLPGGTMHS